jgi:hypothetical protein
LERDLAAARLTQQSLIPQNPPTIPGWEVAACYRPVIEVGGDIYGWLPSKDKRWLFWIADAVGHGASAALLTTLAKLLFHRRSVEHDEPITIMQAVNNDFRGIFAGRSFMTAMCVALDAKTGRASLGGAGHPPLLVSRFGRGTEAVASSAPPLGLLEGLNPLETIVDLVPGDAFVLYTDGLFGPEQVDRPRLTPTSWPRCSIPLPPTRQDPVIAHAKPGGAGWGERFAAGRCFGDGRRPHRLKNLRSNEDYYCPPAGEALITLYAENQKDFKTQTESRLHETSAA